MQTDVLQISYIFWHVLQGYVQEKMRDVLLYKHQAQLKNSTRSYPIKIFYLHYRKFQGFINSVDNASVQIATVFLHIYDARF